MTAIAPWSITVITVKNWINGGVVMILDAIANLSYTPSQRSHTKQLYFTLRSAYNILSPVLGSNTNN
ncbi:hypothetical protein LC613_28215 [Nostoc sphaeroides CHAB 2801]|uniref:hypothetical protein n=1 Tax=Nostoc sphaeroides TaxID=446679 RepID=UPI0015F30E6B|nr:hypothetical protein [Nostoc sphaeroides]MCC5631618.1 hypothetical protein [Nostoc sphaeroides CHAB 2801]